MLTAKQLALKPGDSVYYKPEQGGVSLRVVSKEPSKQGDTWTVELGDLGSVRLARCQPAKVIPARRAGCI
jgi:hypothetical protein